MSFFEQYDLKSLSNLDLLAKQVVEGFMIGLHKSPFHGFSVEFAEHRLYNPGEATKNIDWKVYARSDKMFVKNYEEETNLRCQIIIDTSSSMYFPVREKNDKFLNKLEFSALASASIMNLLRRQRDAFGLSLYNHEVSLHTKCKSSTTHYNLLLSYIDKLIAQPQNDIKTSTAECLHLIAESTHKRSMIMLFSDMFENSEQSDELFSAMQHLKHNKHEVILFHVTDQSKELEFEYDNRPYQFIDMETGEKLKLQSNQLKDYYKNRVQTFRNELKMRCLQYKIDFVEADINAGFHPILQSYLVKRSKMS